jgi:ferric iron reductase protein FhuF
VKTKKSDPESRNFLFFESSSKKKAKKKSTTFWPSEKQQHNRHVREEEERFGLFFLIKHVQKKAVEKLYRISAGFV